MNEVAKSVLRLLVVCVPLLAGCGGSPGDGDEASASSEQSDALSASAGSSCGGFKGSVTWSPYHIYVTGKLADSCGAGSYTQLFLTYDSLYVGHQNYAIATAGTHSTVGVNFTARGGSVGLLYPSHISVTVCSHSTAGWHCGAAEHF
ncbi:MAG TPA: hypothetical protein VIF62_13930 [Labilithrix sp.]|jgi:hypothetical protein